MLCALFFIDSWVWYRTWSVHFVPFVTVHFKELISSSNLSPHPHVILHEGLARSCRIHCLKKRRKTYSLGNRCPCQSGWGVAKKGILPGPHPPWRAPSPQGEGYLSLFETVDSATPSKPFVQNDKRVRWEIGRRIQVLLMFTVKESSRQDKSSLLLRVWNDFISVTTTYLSDLLPQSFRNVFAFWSRKTFQCRF